MLVKKAQQQLSCMGCLKKNVLSIRPLINSIGELLKPPLQETTLTGLAVPQLIILLKWSVQTTSKIVGSPLPQEQGTPHSKGLLLGSTQPFHLPFEKYQSSHQLPQRWLPSTSHQAD